MRKRFVKAFCAALCIALAFGFSSCGMLKTIRENAEKAARQTILETPSADALVSYYNTALETSLREAAEVYERTSVSAGRPHAQGEADGVKIFDAAADTLKNMIMQFSPGAGERPLNGERGLLMPLDAAAALGVSAERNQRAEPVTDEKGNEVSDEDGNAVTEIVTTDNLLKTDIRYYAEETVKETAEDGTVSERTENRPADAAVIESVFGPLREKETVLAAFNAVKDYLQVRDYTVTYKDCAVHAETELDTGRLQTASFTRNMAVSAAVTGVGRFAGLGDFTVTFDLRETAEYVFAYPEDIT